MKRFLYCTLLAGWMAAQAACGQDAPSSLPPATTVGNVTYLSGGIGIDESTAMKQAASR
jgi:predicted small lipoprotein YifL